MTKPKKIYEELSFSSSEIPARVDDLIDWLGEKAEEIGLPPASISISLETEFCYGAEEPRLTLGYEREETEADRLKAAKLEQVMLARERAQYLSLKQKFEN